MDDAEIRPLIVRLLQQTSRELIKTLKRRFEESDPLRGTPSLIDDDAALKQDASDDDPASP